MNWSDLRKKITYPVSAILVLVVIWALIMFSSQLSKNNILSKPLIGVLKIENVILYSEELIKDIESLQDNDNVKGVILKVNSPGGAVTPTYEIYQALKRLSEKKPLYASMSSVAASGGYWVSLAAKKIYATPSTITGSIGVISEQIGVKKLLDKIGVEPRVFKAGENKDVGSPFRPITPSEQRFIEKILIDMHQVFIDVVLSDRNLDTADASNILDGKIFTGNQAKAVGLIDEISDYYGVLQDLKKELNLTEVEEYILPEEKYVLAEQFFDLSLFFQPKKIIENLVHQNYNSFWALYSP